MKRGYPGLTVRSRKSIVVVGLVVIMLMSIAHAIDFLSGADLATGSVVQTGRLPLAATSGAFSADGAKFTYRAWDAAGGMTSHLYVAGGDRTLYVH